MCGIAGAIGHVDDSVLEAVEAMSLEQQHRGPDGHGIWVGAPARAAQPVAKQQQGGTTEGTSVVVQQGPQDSSSCVAFAHRRLAIIDLNEVANQPMVDPITGCTICFNGEVYNFMELRRELEESGVSFRSKSDTEVILQAYVKWGRDSVERLRGMFAFAIWDPRSERVLLARDRLGIKPLYVCDVSRGGGRTVLFASEIRSLLASDLVERRIDPMGLSTYLWNGFVSGHGTIVRGVRLVEAGTTEQYLPADLSSDVRRFWSLPCELDQTGTVEQMRDSMQEAVTQRLVSDVPLGVFLSGGIDSSAVAALAVESGVSDLKTFNIGFEEAEYDESSYARAVADGLGTDHTEIRIRPEDFRDQLDDALRSIDQPTFDAINTYLVSRAVREAGLTVALAGTGGDELFGGYSSFKDLPRARRVAQLTRILPPPLRRWMAARIVKAKTGWSGPVPPQVRWGKLGDVLCTSGLVDAYQVSYSLFTRQFMDQLTFVDPSHGVRTGLRDARYDELRALTRGLPPLQAISLLELSSFIGDRLLRDTDAASMAVSLEVRVPFLDHKVVECASRLPTGERYFPLGSKSMIRRTALGKLDPAIFDRPKSGFVLPIEKWCRTELESTVEAMLLDAELCSAVGLEATTVRNLWRAFQNRSPGIYWSRIWSLFVLMWWAQEHRITL